MTNLKPILKWAGGKRQLLPEIKRALPKNGFEHYFEPFVGGGAVLFDIAPDNATVNDLNSELINLYEIVKANVEELINLLLTYPNAPDFFYALRKLDRDEDLYTSLSSVERAARTVYLNKTCFNGLYRVNRAGQFNTPFGRYKNPNICDEHNLRAVSYYFNTANIRFLAGDYKLAVASASAGDFVYLDPPYDPINSTSSFTNYAATGFTQENQIELKKLCDNLTSRGIKFMLSNSATEFITDLYSDYNIELVSASRAINSIASKRGKIDEVLVTNYDE